MPGMTFHDTLWVVTGTAAPVIALAAILSLSEVNRAYSGLLHTDGSLQTEIFDVEDALEAAGKTNVEQALEATRKTNLENLQKNLDRCNKKIMSRVQPQLGFQLVNILLQAALLAISLLAAEYQSDVLPLWIATGIPVVGVLLLAETGIAMILTTSNAESEQHEVELGLRDLKKSSLAGGSSTAAGLN